MSKTYTHKYSFKMSNGFTMTGRASSAELAMKAAKSAATTKPSKLQAHRISDIIIEAIA